MTWLTKGGGQRVGERKERNRSVVVKAVGDPATDRLRNVA